VVRKLAARLALGSVALLAGQLVYVVKRPLPSFDGLDASASVGDPNLPALRIATLGDSTLTGPGLDDSRDIWIRQAAAMLSDRYHIEVQSFGVGGSQAKDVALAQAPLVGPVDIAIVAVGSNDALHGTSVRQTERWLTQAVEQLLDNAELVILAGVGDLADIPRLSWPLNAIARYRGTLMDDVHRRVAQTSDRIIKVPIREVAAPRFKQTANTFSPDLFHVNATGHQIWAETLLPHLEEAIGRLRP
jgi:lysophospholipase L1-like esterase